ncbi:MAG: type II secretion system protein GspM [Burkholderiales bacterium]|jgi:type II secretory pathway component PulM
MATAAQLDTRDRLTQWWRLRTRNERSSAVAGTALAAVALAWLLLWAPLQRDIARLERDLSAQRAALGDTRRQADAMAGLERRALPPERDPRAGLDATLAQLGIQASAIDRVDADRLRVTVDAVSFDALTVLLEALQRDAALHVADLTVAARVEPGMVRAELTLVR